MTDDIKLSPLPESALCVSTKMLPEGRWLFEWGWKRAMTKFDPGEHFDYEEGRHDYFNGSQMRAYARGAVRLNAGACVPPPRVSGGRQRKTR